MAALRNVNGLASWRHAENSLQSLNVTMPATVIPGGDEGDRQRGPPRDQALVEQPRGKLTSALPTTGKGDGPVQRHQDLAEIRLHPCFDPQPFQPPTPSQPPRHIQTSPGRCDGRVASTCCLKVLYYGFFFSAPVSLTMPSSALRRGYSVVVPCSVAGIIRLPLTPPDRIEMNRQDVLHRGRDPSRCVLVALAGAILECPDPAPAR